MIVDISEIDSGFVVNKWMLGSLQRIDHFAHRSNAFLYINQSSFQPIDRFLAAAVGLEDKPFFGIFDGFTNIINLVKILVYNHICYRESQIIGLHFHDAPFARKNALSQNIEGL